LIMRPTILFVCDLFFHYSTPPELKEQSKIKRVFKLAEKKFEARKNFLTSSMASSMSFDLVKQNELYNNFSLTRFSSNEKIVNTHNNYFKSLEDSVVANKLVNGKLQYSKDPLCTYSNKYADPYCYHCTELLATHYESTSKHHTGGAYHYQ